MGAIADEVIPQGGAIAALGVPEQNTVTPQQADAESFRLTASETAKGVRSGFNSLGGSISGLVSSMASTLGMDQFAASRMKDAEEQVKFASAIGPEKTDVRKLEDFTDLANFVQGAFGQSLASTLPALAGAVVGRKLGGIRGAYGGGFAASLAPNAGEQALRVRNTNATPGEKLQNALATGAVSAALDTVLPGKVVNSVTRAAVKKGGQRGFYGGVLKGGATEAPTEMTQTAVSQAMHTALEPRRNKDEDWPELLNSAAAGAVGGAGLGGAGRLAEGAAGMLPSRETFKRGKTQSVDDVEKNLKVVKQPIDEDDDSDIIGDPNISTHEDIMQAMAEKGEKATEALGKMWEQVKEHPKFKKFGDLAWKTDPEARQEFVASLKQRYDDLVIKPKVDAGIKNIKGFVDKANKKMHSFDVSDEAMEAHGEKFGKDLKATWEGVKADPKFQKVKGWATDPVQRKELINMLATGARDFTNKTVKKSYNDVRNFIKGATKPEVKESKMRNKVDYDIYDNMLNHFDEHLTKHLTPTQKLELADYVKFIAMHEHGKRDEVEGPGKPETVEVPATRDATNSAEPLIGHGKAHHPQTLVGKAAAMEKAAEEERLPISGAKPKMDLESTSTDAGDLGIGSAWRMGLPTDKRTDTEAAGGSQITGQRGIVPEGERTRTDQADAASQVYKREGRRETFRRSIPEGLLQYFPKTAAQLLHETQRIVAKGEKFQGKKEVGAHDDSKESLKRDVKTKKVDFKKVVKFHEEFGHRRDARFEEIILANLSDDIAANPEARNIIVKHLSPKLLGAVFSTFKLGSRQRGKALHEVGERPKYEEQPISNEQLQENLGEKEFHKAMKYSFGNRAEIVLEQLDRMRDRLTSTPESFFDEGVNEDSFEIKDDTKGEVTTSDDVVEETEEEAVKPGDDLDDEGAPKVKGPWKDTRLGVPMSQADATKLKKALEDVYQFKDVGFDVFATKDGRYTVEAIDRVGDDALTESEWESIREGAANKSGIANNVVSVVYMQIVRNKDQTPMYVVDANGNSHPRRQRVENKISLPNLSKFIMKTTPRGDYTNVQDYAAAVVARGLSRLLGDPNVKSLNKGSVEDMIKLPTTRQVKPTIGTKDTPAGQETTVKNTGVSPEYLHEPVVWDIPDDTLMIKLQKEFITWGEIKDRVNVSPEAARIRALISNSIESAEQAHSIEEIGDKDTTEDFEGIAKLIAPLADEIAHVTARVAEAKVKIRLLENEQKKNPTKKTAREIKQSKFFFEVDSGLLSRLEVAMDRIDAEIDRRVTEGDEEKGAIRGLVEDTRQRGTTFAETPPGLRTVEGDTNTEIHPRGKRDRGPGGELETGIPDRDKMAGELTVNDSIPIPEEHRASFKAKFAAINKGHAEARSRRNAQSPSIVNVGQSDPQEKAPDGRTWRDVLGDSEADEEARGAYRTMLMARQNSEATPVKLPEKASEPAKPAAAPSPVKEKPGKHPFTSTTYDSKTGDPTREKFNRLTGTKVKVTEADKRVAAGQRDKEENTAYVDERLEYAERLRRQGRHPEADVVIEKLKADQNTEKTQAELVTAMAEKRAARGKPAKMTKVKKADKEIAKKDEAAEARGKAKEIAKGDKAAEADHKAEQAARDENDGKVADEASKAAGEQYDREHKEHVLFDRLTKAIKDERKYNDNANDKDDVDAPDVFPGQIIEEIANNSGHSTSGLIRFYEFAKEKMTERDFGDLVEAGGFEPLNMVLQERLQNGIDSARGKLSAEYLEVYAVNEEQEIHDTIANIRNLSKDIREFEAKQGKFKFSAMKNKSNVRGKDELMDEYVAGEMERALEEGAPKSNVKEYKKSSYSDLKLRLSEMKNKDEQRFEHHGQTFEITIDSDEDMRGVPDGVEEYRYGFMNSASGEKTTFGGKLAHEITDLYKSREDAIQALKDSGGKELTGAGLEAFKEQQRKSYEAVYGAERAWNQSPFSKDVWLPDEAMFDETYEIAKKSDGYWLRHATTGDNHVNKPFKTLIEAKAYANKEIDRQSPDKLSAMNVGQNGPVSADQMKEIEAYIRKVLGPSAKTLFESMTAAGSFIKDKNGMETIRIAKLAMDPMGIAHHEAAHALMSRLVAVDPKAAQTLLAAAGSPTVITQLRHLLRQHPDAIKQLSDPEERLAYMYQFWASKDATGKSMLTVGPKTNTIFEQIKQFFRRLAGIWGETFSQVENLEKAEKIFAMFESGNLADKNTVAEVLRRESPKTPFEKATEMWPGATRWLGKAFFTADGLIRGTNIPAFIEIADKMYTGIGQQGKDPGMLQTRFMELNKFQNKMSDVLKNFKEDQHAAILKHLHDETDPTGDLAPAVTGIRALLKEVHAYMVDHKVKAVVWNDTGGAHGRGGYEEQPLGFIEKYFPRYYDRQKIFAERAQFIAALTGAGVPEAAANQVVDNILRHGKQDPKESDYTAGLTYYAPNSQERSLNVPTSVIAPWLQQDLSGSLYSYLSYTTRRAEYASRFGNQGQKIEAATELAKTQGATDAQIATFHQAVMAMEGSLGFDISPNMKQVMGGLVTYQNFRLLPLALFTSLVDPVGIAIRGGGVGESFKAFGRGIRNIISEDKDDSYELAKLVGSISVSSDAHMLADAYGTQYLTGWQRKANTFLFKFNGMEAWNRSMRVAATGAASRFLIHHVTKANKHSERFLQELNLTAADVVVVNDKLVLNDKVKNAIVQWVDGAVLRPNAAVRTIWMSDPHWMLIAHLKQFTYSFQKTIVSRVVHEMQHGNYTPAYALVSYVPMIIAADYMRALFTPGGTDDEKLAKLGLGGLLWRGTQRAGILGPGQWAVDAYGDLGHSKLPVASILGPTVQQGYDVAMAGLGSGPSEQRTMLGEFKRALPGHMLVR